MLGYKMNANIKAMAIRTGRGMRALPKTGAKRSIPPMRKNTTIKNGKSFTKLIRYSIGTFIDSILSDYLIYVRCRRSSCASSKAYKIKTPQELQALLAKK